jgi:hypothetical protein
MFPVWHRVDCVLSLAEPISYTRVWRKFNQVYPNQTVQIYRSVMSWDRPLKETGSFLRKHRSPRRAVSQVKVKLSLCLTEHHIMKAYWGVEVQLHEFLTAALDGGEWSASRPSRFTPMERARVEILWRCCDNLFFGVPPPRQAMHFLQRSTHFSKKCCRSLITSKFLASELLFSWFKKPINLMGRDLECMKNVLMGFHRTWWAHPLPFFNRATLTLHYGCSTILKSVLLKRQQLRFREVGGTL